MSTIHQWLGPATRLTLWAVTSDPFHAVLLGHIQDDGATWSAWLAPGLTSAEPHRLRSLDDREAAGRTLCARLRVPFVGLPGITEDDDV